MKVWKADHCRDFAAILEGGRSFIRHANLAELPPADGPEITDALAVLLSIDGMHVLLAGSDDRTEVYGGIGLLLAPSLWDRSRLTSEELFWWCGDNAPPQAAMRLLREAKQFGAEQGVKIWTFHDLPNSPSGVEKVYQRMGFSLTGRTFSGVSK